MLTIPFATQHIAHCVQAAIGDACKARTCDKL